MKRSPKCVNLESSDNKLMLKSPYINTRLFQFTNLLKRYFIAQTTYKNITKNAEIVN